MYASLSKRQLCQPVGLDILLTFALLIHQELDEPNALVCENNFDWFYSMLVYSKRSNTLDRRKFVSSLTSTDQNMKDTLYYISNSTNDSEPDKSGTRDCKNR